MSGTDRQYPLPIGPDEEPRFNAGLLRDVCVVLEQHGYPRPTTGADLVELQTALFRFLYGDGA